MEELRTVKDERELAALRASCALNHRVYEALEAALAPGMTERDVAWLLERLVRLFRARGCETGVSLEYLTRLYQGYEEFLGEISRLIPVLRVQWNEFWDVQPLAEAITREYTRSSFLREVAQLA